MIFLVEAVLSSVRLDPRGFTPWLYRKVEMLQRFGALPRRKVVGEMPIQSPGEYMSPKLEKALKVCRLANAEWCADNAINQMRYVVSCHIHEAVREENILIVDSMSEAEYSVTEMLDILSPESRMRLLYDPSFNKGL